MSMRFKGKQYSEESKKNMSEIQKSRKLSEDVDGRPVKALKKWEDPTLQIMKNLRKLEKSDKD